MDGLPREDQHNQQKAVNPTRDNDNDLYLHVDESTSQNTNSNNGSQNKNVPLHQHVPLIDLSLDENITKDGKVIEEENQETNNKRENFIMQLPKMAAHSNEMMPGNESNNEEMYEVLDLSKSSAEKEEVYKVPQKKIETVSDNRLKLNESFKHSVIKNVTQTVEVKSKKNNNEKQSVEHVSSIMATELLRGRDVKLFRHESTQTDNIKNDQFSHKETQTNNNNYAVNNEEFRTQLHAVVNRNVLQYKTIIQNAIQEFFTPYQIAIFPDGTVPGDDVMRRQAVRNAVPATMQAGLPHQHHPSTGFNFGRRTVIHHPYVSQHNIRIRNQINRIIQQSNEQSQLRYRQNSMTQNLETEMANNNQNIQGQKRQ